jgi:hypothetical protein
MPRDNDGYDDKPKRSWSEIDKMRDGKRSGGGSSSSGSRQKLEKSATYGRYKSAADAFFSGEALPDVLAEKLDPTGEGRARKDALQKVKDAEDFKTFATLSKAYVEKHGLFEDPYLLDRLLGHPNEGLVLKALEKLSAMLAEGVLKAPKSLPERLKSLELGSDSPEVQDTAKALAKALRDAPR